jgi:hypothetical protein
MAGRVRTAYGRKAECEAVRDRIGIDVIIVPSMFVLDGARRRDRICIVPRVCGTEERKF